MVIPRTLIFILEREKVLLLKGAPTKRLWANLYNGIGGHIERGEHAQTAANRELYEESGITGVDLEFCGSIMIDVSQETGISIFVFKGEYLGGTLNSSSEGKLEWVDQKKLTNYPLVEDLYVLLPKILSRNKNDRPFFARYSYDRDDKLVIEFA
jgi:8-oxo-dGTP diphosphatase